MNTWAESRIHAMIRDAGLDDVAPRTISDTLRELRVEAKDFAHMLAVIETDLSEGIYSPEKAEARMQEELEIHRTNVARILAEK